MDTFTYVRAQTLCKKGHHMEKNNLNCVKKQPLCTDVAWEQFVFSEHLGVTWIELTALVVARVTWFGGLSLESRWQTRASLQLPLAGILQGVIVGRCWYEPRSSGAGHFPTLVGPSVPVLHCTVVTHGHHDMQKFASYPSKGYVEPLKWSPAQALHVPKDSLVLQKNSSPQASV